MHIAAVERTDKIAGFSIVVVKNGQVTKEYPVTCELFAMLERLSPESGKQVAEVLMMLAANAVQNESVWQQMLAEHLKKAMWPANLEVGRV